jgi:hypothetical protein
MSARIVANNFADLRTQLKDATPEQPKATEAYWAALDGVIAATHRHLIDEEIEVRQAVARMERSAAKPGCWRCETTPAAGTCCSSHQKDLCHLCYRRTHFVEVCVAGCSECAAENLPVKLSELKAASR